MRVSGKKVADEVKEELKLRIDKLKEKGITPKLAIITLGPEGAWETFVRNKLRTAQELGIIAELISLADADKKTLLATIEKVDKDSSYHGIIVQRPIPPIIDRESLVNAISKEKDVDGFRIDSEFEVPVWLATKKLIEVSLRELGIKKSLPELVITIIGKGETAGKPAIEALTKLGSPPNVVDSKTENPGDLIKKADIVISSAGKSEIVKPEYIKPGAILVGVGTHVEDGKLRGDYNEEKIENIAGSYTPTPFGVGPVNLAFLFANLIQAAENQTT